MTYEQFIDLVAEMRQAQKEYFKTRDRNILSKSKQLEAQVDAEINKVNSKQLNLF